MKQVTARLILLLSCTVLTSSCDSVFADYKDVDPIDRDAGLIRDDFKNMRDIAAVEKGEAEITANLSNVVEPPIPDLAEIIAAPPRPKIGQTQLVSLAVTDDVPLKDVLIELARLANVDIDVDASIRGGVSLRANDKPFNEVIERIADMAGLRYNIKNGVLRVERDTPYIKLYSLDLLNSERSANGSISVGGNSISGGDSGSTTGSTSSITAKTDSDFWVKFESSLSQILSYTPSRRTSATTISAQPAPAVNPSSPSSPNPVQAPAPAPVADVASGGDGSFFVVNRQASTLTVSGTEKQQDMIRKFLEKIVENTSSQVLIEAKIVEVNLSDNYQSGINWTNFGGTGLNFAGNLSSAVKGTTDNDIPVLTVLKNDILRSGVDLSAAVKLLNEFGTTRALSSPRLNAMNNQQAVLSFVENLVYFNVTLSSTPATTTGTTTTPGTVTATSEKQVEPVGIILNLQPSINMESNEITLSVRPTLKRFVKFIDDPGFKINLALALQSYPVGSSVATALSSTVSQIPQVETRELDSIVKIKSGQTLVIGGLLEDKITNLDGGVPYASEVPILGNLFKNISDTTRKTELVIFLHPVIIKNPS
ncbi:MAG: hypothetical protein ABL857_08440, partial [Rickettsiales bacterium]